MLAYHNDPAVKTKYVERFRLHREADQVIQGTGFDHESRRGCFVGCTLDEYDHSRFPIELGWPEWLARLADRIFEGIPKAEAPQFGTDLLAAVTPGVDLEPVRWVLAIARHERQLASLESNVEPYAEQVRNAIKEVIDHAKKMLDDAYSDGSAAWSARSAAESAAWSAAWSAWSARSAESAAWSAAWSARSAAESAARSAAWSARSAARSAESAAWSARSAAWSARSAEYQWERETLLAIIRKLSP